MEACVGQEVEILCEGYSKTNKERLSGRTSQNKIVVFTGDHAKLTGQIFRLKVDDYHNFTLYGSVL